MDILALKRDTAAIEDGRWVGAEEVPGLGDIRVKVRGAMTAVSRDLFAAKQRKIDPRDKTPEGGLKPNVLMNLLREMLAEYNIVDIDGLTMGGKPIGADEARKLVLDPEFQPLADLIIEAVSAVDSTRVNRESELAKN